METGPDESPEHRTARINTNLAVGALRTVLKYARESPAVRKAKWPVIMLTVIALWLGRPSAF